MRESPGVDRSPAGKFPGRHPVATTIAAAAVGGILASLAWPPRQPVLVWNSSASSPLGLYAVVPARRISRGDLVIARPPVPAAALAALRGYLPRGIPLVKTVVALPGDRICASRDTVMVNARVVARRLQVDRSGRPLPQWIGCLTLSHDRLLVLGLASGASFDGRYFGPTRLCDVVGTARLLWPR